MKKAIRPRSSSGGQPAPGLILCAVRWHLRYSLSFRDVEELLGERGLEGITRQPGAGSSATVLNWSNGCAVISSQPNRSWRVDETYVRVKGRWCYYLYRAIDSTGLSNT